MRADFPAGGGYKIPGIFHRALEMQAAWLSACALAWHGPGVSIIDTCVIHVQPRPSHNSRGPQWVHGDKGFARGPSEALRMESHNFQLQGLTGSRASQQPLNGFCEE